MENRLDLEIGEPVDDAEWEAFRSFLVKLQDVAARHFAHDELDHAKMADFLWKRQSNCLDEFWSKNEVLDDLARLKSSLKSIERVLGKLPEAISREIQREALRPILGRQKPDLLNDQIKSTEEALSQLTGWQAYQSLLTLENHVPEISPLIGAAERLAATGCPVGNKGLEAWRTVEACVDLCELIPGYITVPKAMGNSGPFYRFLGDVFFAMGLEEDPVAAFKGWRRHVVRTKQENP